MIAKLNDLTGTEWLPATRSIFVDGVNDPRNVLTWDGVSVGSFSVMSTATARPPEKINHPATFPESDAKRLVRLFTREGGRVFDPFIGTGSTALACMAESRNCIGFELYEKWVNVARERVLKAGACNVSVEISATDALDGIKDLPDGSQDFILTSPPYWGILGKKDHKALSEREGNGLETDYGQDPDDLSKIGSYDAFIDALTEHFAQWRRVLVHRGYAAVIVSDFRHGQRYYPFHAHIAAGMESAGFTTQGMIVIVQDSKRLYPYGFPTSYVPNICNQFVVVGRSL